jgi:L-asparagine oxygenase
MAWEEISLTSGNVLDDARSVRDADGRSWTIAAPSEPGVRLGPLESAELAYAAHRIATRHRGLPGIDDHRLLVEVEVGIRRACPDLVAALVEFRLAGTRDGIIVLRGLPVDQPLPSTPERGAFAGAWHELSQSTVVQLMVMSVLGDVIAYADEKEGRLVQDISPVPGAENRQENTGSSLLELHTEDGFHPHKPDFISLLCLRADHELEAMTVACGIRSVVGDLADEHVQALRQPSFRIRLSSSFVGTDVQAYSQPLAVLTGCPSDPDLCADFHAMEPLTDEAATAFEALRGLMWAALVGLVLRPGDMIVIDNRKAVHGRTGFAPRYDGQDRWLRRCFAVTDLRASNGHRYLDSRIHRPLTEAAATS